jgi:IS5 family transposase
LHVERANRMLRKLRTYLGRVIRDVARKIEGNDGLEVKFARLLSLERRVHQQQPRQRGPKVYSLHAPEVECIGEGKPHRPYEFGVKVSVATTLSRARGGRFVTHVKALPGNPYDGHTLATVIPDMEALVGNTIERILADKGYRGHNAPPGYKVQGLPLGPKARGDTLDQARAAPQSRRRARHRPSQSQTPHGPQLSLVPAWRCHQRRPRRRRLQLPPPHPLAQALVAPNPGRPLPMASDQSSLKSGFFTDDNVG